MRDSFGARLRRHRELRGVSLAEIAEKTKIKASMLDGLERDDISQWPAGIFRRAYVRAYAAAIGFDADTAVREFLTEHPEPIEPLEPLPPPPTGLRGLFESFRRRGPAGPPPAAAAEVATATAGKRPADAAFADLARPPAVVPPVSAAAKAASAPSSRKTSDVIAPVAAPGPAAPVADRRSPNLLAAAQICTELGRVDDVDQMLSLLGDAAKIVGARGLIVWVWDGAAGELKPALVHGYSAKVRARFRGIAAAADNLIAATYRAGAPLARSGALAVPLLAPSTCVGVLAIEVKDGREQDQAIRALATFFAAMLAQLVAVGASSDSAVSSEASPPLDPPVATV